MSLCLSVPSLDPVSSDRAEKSQFSRVRPGYVDHARRGQGKKKYQREYGYAVNVRLFLSHLSITSHTLTLKGKGEKENESFRY